MHVYLSYLCELCVGLPIKIAGKDIATKFYPFSQKVTFHENCPLPHPLSKFKYKQLSAQDEERSVDKRDQWSRGRISVGLRSRFLH